MRADAPAAIASTHEKRAYMKHSLRKKTVILIVTIAVVIGLTGILVSSRFIGRLIDSSYEDKARDIARTMAAVIDTEQAKTLNDAVQAIYRDTEEVVYSDDWGSPEFDAYIARYAALEESEAFQSLLAQLRKIQDVNDVDCLYLSSLGGDSAFLYLVDGAYEDACPPGCADPIYEENRELLYNPGRGYPPYITNTEPYGWLVTAGAPVYDEDGGVICYAMVDISMDTVRGEQARFITTLAAGLAGLTVLICLIAILIVNRVIIRPINRLSSAAEHYDARLGDSSEIDNLTIKTHDEIQSLYSSFKQMTHDIEGYIDNLMRTSNELSQTRIKASQMDELAHRDALTGVGSKLAYNREVQALTAEMARGDARFGIVMIDLNWLKKLNDSYGHEKGDIAIRKICSMICSVFDENAVYRLGGDEFAVILRGDDCAGVEHLVAEFKTLVDASENSGGEPWEAVSAAIGYALYDGDDTVNDVFRRADYSMYECKKSMKAARV